MSRRSKILELALAKSEILENCEENESCSNETTNEKIEHNVPLDPLQPGPSFLETGHDLLTFKYNLRQRTPVKHQNQVADSDETEELYSPIVSEYMPPQENAPIVVTPDADTESVNDEVKENYDNILIQENNGMFDGDQNQELRDVVVLDQPIQNTSAESSNLIDNERLPDAEEPSTSSQKKGKKNYPKKTSPGRKRILNKENWIAEIRKRNKNLGEEFTNRKGQIIPKKIIKPSCGAKCPRKCRELITENQRNSIFNNFWSLGDHNKQADYLSRLVKRVSRKQIMASSAWSSRRKCSYEYYLYLDGQEIRTCKTMFLNTFSISDMWIQTLFKKINNSATGTILNDIRGNRSRKNIIPDQIKQSIRNHISEMPLVDSHYVRSRSSKQYLDAELSLPILYKLYTEFMKEKHPDQEVATSRQYREIFITEFNIEFNKPKKDQCPKCDIFRNASVTDKTNLEYDFALHIANKEVVRTLKDIDKSRSKNSDSVVSAVYDLQKILSTPQSEVSIFYYKRKLATYNFTIFDIGKRIGYCYVWDETIGRKGSNEISSFVFDFIKMKVQEGFTEFNFYSDSCGGQNKNRIVFSMYACASKMFNININHHFFEVGHSQNEGDAMHALIERRKKYKVIYVPQQWVTLIRCAKSTGSPYVVKEVNQHDILDYKQLVSLYKNWERDVNNAKVTWSKIMHIQLISSLPNIITFQYDSLSDTEMSINIAEVSFRSGRTRRSAREPLNNDQNISIPKAYNALLPISVAKYKDLINLCNSKAIPEIYHDYFVNLPHLHQHPHNIQRSLTGSVHSIEVD